MVPMLYNSFHAQLNTVIKFIMLINVRMPKFDGILTIYM